MGGGKEGKRKKKQMETPPTWTQKRDNDTEEERGRVRSLQTKKKRDLPNGKSIMETRAGAAAENGLRT